MNYCLFLTLSASEFSLTIALVVFVMITIFLLAIIILLLLSKSFRAFFFREHKTDTNRQSEAVQTEAQQIEPESDPTAEQPTTQKQKRRKKADDLFGVPTIPLTLNAADISPAPAKRSLKKKTAPAVTDGVKTVDIGQIASQSEKTTYTTRTVPKPTDRKSRKQR